MSYLDEQERADKCNAAMNKQCANRQATGYEQQHKEETNSGFSELCKLRADVSSCIMFTFSSLKHCTKEGNHFAGALLVETKNNNTDEFDEVWIPKKLCCNLDLELGTVYVWKVFAEDKLAEYITEEV